ncbi:MAG TPA: RHS repeat-associated core domain-containing protein, partial [Niastella sp.]
TDHYGNNTYTQYTDDLEIYREIDEAGNITGYVYNERNLVKQTILPDGNSLQFHYNEYNQPALIINTDGNSQTYGYDARRRPRFINYPNGKTTAYEYNEKGQLHTIVETGNHKTIMTFDEDGNLAGVQLSDGATAHWKYDALGRCVQATNGSGQVRRLTYDALNRVNSLHLPDGNTIVLQYNAYEEVIRAADRDGEVTFEYTPMGSIKKRRQNNTELRFIYDTEERLRTIVNEENKTYRLDYNKRGEIISEIKFDGVQLQFERDATGNIIKTNRPGGRSTQYEYDANDNIIRILYHDGSWELFTYDKNGNLQETSNEYSTVRFRRNKLGFVETEEQDEYTVQSTYDKLGNRIRIASSLGADIKMKRNQLGLVQNMQAAVAEASRPEGITAWQVHMKYNPFGQEIERILPGGLTSEWQYDQAGRPGEQKVSRNGVVQSWKKYTWDANEQLTNIFDALAKTSTGFKYDAFGNLALAQYADKSIVHRTADESGNFYETTAKTDRTYNTAGALQECKKYIYKYDDEGRLISKTNKTTHKKTRYVWFANGMLRKVLKPDGKTIEFTYDALGRRISKRCADKVTRWVWDANVPLHEWTYDIKDKPRAVVNEWGEMTWDKEEPNPNNLPAGQAGITWIYDADGFVPCAKIEQGTTYSIISDHLGTPKEAYDATGKKVWECMLDIYGRSKVITGNKDFIPFRYQGQYEDAETGLYYNRFRYYDAEAGNYISQDPIGIDGGPKVYGYVPDTNTLIDVAGLTPLDLATLKHMAQHTLDFSTGKDQAVFWSTRSSTQSNMEYAQKWADKVGKKTLEQTKGGKYLNDLKLFGSGGAKMGISAKEAAEIWDIASERFAKAASGEVNVFSTYSKKISAHGLRTWWRIEKPALLKNTKVTRITRRKRDGSKTKNGHIKCR